MLLIFLFLCKVSPYNTTEKYADKLDSNENDDSSITSFEKGILTYQIIH